VAELNAQGAVVRRYLPGPGVDEYPVWYEGAGISNRRYLMRDLQGSVSMVASGGGAAPTTNTYDEYGIPAAGNAGRVQYTGQLWLPEVGLYHYKARAYSPTLGRFLQTDPIGYANSMNWYAYVGNDPLNRSDPTGLAMIATTTCARYSAAGPGVSGGYCKTTYEQFGEDSDKSRGQPPPPPPQPRPQDTAACAISRKYAKAAAEAQLAANGLQLAGLAVAGYGLTEGGKGISPLTRGAAKILEFYSVAPEIGGFADSVIAGTAAAYATKDPAALGSAVALFIVTQGSAAKFEGTLGMSYGAARLLIGKGADEAADRLTPNGCKKKK
jgi:RHS repeat-associated protein